MQQALLSIDIGSTSIKAAAFTVGGEQIIAEKKAMQYHTDNKGLLYVQPDEVWESVIAVLKGTAAFLKNGYCVAGISVTGMGNDGVPIDREGKWVFPVIPWKCNRTAAQLEDLTNTFGLEAYYLITGLQARTVDTVFKLMWLKDHETEIYNKIYKWLMIEDYVNYRLCGSMVTDFSIACTTGLFDIKHRCWSKELALAFGLRLDMLPDIAQSGTVIGAISNEASEGTGLPAGIPIVLGGWDIQCAALTLKSGNDEHVIDTMGTWETVNIVSSSLILNKETFVQGFNACCHVLPGRYTYPVFLLSSSVVEWYIDNHYKANCLPGDITSDEVYQAFISDIEKSPPCANGLLFMPHIKGCFFPGSDPKSLGAYVGIGSATTREDFARALIEGLCYMSREVITKYEKILGKSLINIMVSGGGIRNDTWMQIKADVYGRKICLSNVVETTALGAAVIAGIGTGLYKNMEDAQDHLRTGSREIFPDQKDSRQYAQYYPVYKGLYTALKGVNHDLYRLKEQSAGKEGCT